MTFVIGLYFKTDFIGCQHDVAAVDYFLNTIDVLIGEWAVQTQRALGAIEQQIARYGKLRFVFALHAHANARRIGAWVNDQIVFQFTGPAVVHQVDTRIYGILAQLRVRRHIASPMGRVRALQVVGARYACLACLDRGVLSCPDKIQLHNRIIFIATIVAGQRHAVVIHCGG